MANTSAKVNQTAQFDGEFSQAEAVLPMQFHSNRRGIRSIEPLRRLMVAMLVDAVRVFQTKSEVHRPSARQEFAEVQRWIFSDDETGMFSFTPVCEALEIDPQTIRKGLVRWKEERLVAEKPQKLIRHSPVQSSRTLLDEGRETPTKSVDALGHLQKVWCLSTTMAAVSPGECRRASDALSESRAASKFEQSAGK
jgi:hypothetical protein